ncbi:hypothetical protein FD724_10945 [Nostoc sp. C057]|uniref:hypothetical protein n=1 Tax=Nostoc sp. C057 TaxID=2576903 RepID=UPI0015C2D2CC|nr:hypothetical protein [Nostoc sp. C057]QLE48579.1 hypothetical protein FD724_10945 [Nostoc sp. C057]
MSAKIMESVNRITRRLMLVVLMLVVSGMMFLSSPAIAATITTVNRENFETEVLKSDKPVVVILANDAASLNNELVSKAEKSFGDKYKIVVGKIEENGQAYSGIAGPRIYPPLPGAVIFKNGNIPTPGFVFNVNDPTSSFEDIKETFEDSQA